MNEENKNIIKAINMYGRVPEQWELLEEIERLNNIIKEVRKYIGSKEHYEDAFDTEIEKINKILDKAKENK